MSLQTIMQTLPRTYLGTLPTPVHRLYATEKALGVTQKLYIKRDDLTGIGSGGNKIRSLEYIIGKAKQDGCDTLIASGQAQSNLCSLAAACAAKAGLNCVLVHNSKQPDTKSGNQLLNHILGTKAIFMGDVPSSQREEYVHTVLSQLKQEGKHPYLIRNGATTGEGALGYVNAVLELMQQCQENEWQISHIFAPGGNGGIASGLIYGNALAGFPFQVHIISVEDDTETLICHIKATIKEIETITGLPCDYSIDQIADIIDAYRGEGWGIDTPQSRQEVLDFARTEGIFIENVYTAKLMYGFKEEIKSGRINGGALVFHSGGFGSLFAQYPQL